MSTPLVNIFSKLLNFSAVLPINLGYEIRFDNDGDGNPIYVGYNITPNASVDANTWFIFKMTYDSGNATRVQLPNSGEGLLYSWTNRATYFA